MLAIFTWPGTPIFIGIICIYAIIQSAIDKKYDRLLAIVGIIVILFADLYLFYPDIYQNLSSGIGYLFKDTALLQQVKEDHKKIVDNKKFVTKLAKFHEIIILTVLFIIAFFIRMVTYGSIFVGNNIRFLEFDPFYHMRRAVSFADHFLSFLTTNLGFPSTIRHDL